MADGTQITAGSGTTIATDDTGATGHTQIIKQAVSANGDVTLIPSDAANGLDVDVTRVQGTVTMAGNATVTGTVTSNIGTTGGLALDATLTGGSQKTKLIDSGGTNVAAVDASGRLSVDASGTTQIVQDSQVIQDNSGFTDGTSKLFMAGHILDEVAGTALTENDAAASRIDSKRAQVQVIEDATTRGQRLSVSAAGAAKVDGSAVTQPVSGTVTSNIGTTNGLALDATLTGGTAKTKIVDSGGTTVATVTAANALKVDNSAVTQPVSGTVTANIGTAGTLALDATLTGGTQKTKIVDSGGTTVATVTAANALKVDGSAVTQPVSGTVTTSPPANASTNVAQLAGTTTDTNSGNKSAGTLRVVVATDQPTPTNPIHVDDNSGSLTVDAPLATPVFVTPTPGTTGGWSPVFYSAQGTSTKTVKATAGTFGGYMVINPNTTSCYVQVFDAASGTAITLGTTAPTMSFGIPGSSAANVEMTNGINMANGIKLACTTTATGSTAPGTGLDVNVWFK